MNRAVLYLRSSKDRSDVSIDAQRRALHELAATRSFIIVGEYVDAVESGKDDDRPGFQSLIADIRLSGRTWDHILALDTSRIARRRALGIIFEEHECKRRGVRVVYKSLPESDPITEMLLKSILQAMDEWHSLTSRVKGLSGMAENVKQGWRAGGKAPRGYALETVATGTIREGVPVTKTRLVVGEDSALMQAFLRARARGVPRHRAAKECGLDAAKTSLIDIERNALVYAGHTTWNRQAERVDGGYVGGSKHRPRSEWVIQKNTHEALITEDEAESILAKIAKTPRRAAKEGSRIYILSGLLKAPDGRLWHGTEDAYRIGSGRRISANSLERDVVAHVMESVKSDEMVEMVAAYYKSMANPAGKANEVATLKRKAAEFEKRINSLTLLLSETTAPDALLRQIESMEKDRSSALAALAERESEVAALKPLKTITPAAVRATLSALADDMSAAKPEMLKETLSMIVESVELSPDTFDAVITYRISPAGKPASNWRPHGEPTLTPVFTHSRPISIRHNRRAA
jgi:site-specific DNA recombinase